MHSKSNRYKIKENLLAKLDDNVSAITLEVNQNLTSEIAEPFVR